MGTNHLKATLAEKLALATDAVQNAATFMSDAWGEPPFRPEEQYLAGTLMGSVWKAFEDQNVCMPMGRDLVAIAMVCLNSSRHALQGNHQP